MLVTHFLGEDMKKLAIVGAALTFAGTAYAADMPLKAPAPYVPVDTWTGFYIGGDIGYLGSRDTTAWNPLPSPVAFGANAQTGSNRISGAMGGVHGGYDWQFATSWVAGIEGDFSAVAAGSGTGNQLWIANPGGTAIPGTFTSTNTNLESLATVRGRLGYLLTPNLMAYGTGGGAWGRVEYSAQATNGLAGAALYNAQTAFTTNSNGWVAGGGIEWLVSGHWMLRAEYLHYHLTNAQNVTVAGPVNFPAFPSNFTWTAMNVDVGRVGLAYKF
jgi:outer membrane immunogenic protein